MALTVQNLDDLSDSSPELGEALQEIQTYINTNVTAGPGNRVAPASFLQGAVPVSGVATPVQTPPPSTISQDPSQAGGGGAQTGNNPQEQV